LRDSAAIQKKKKVTGCCATFAGVGPLGSPCLSKGKKKSRELERAFGGAGGQPGCVMPNLTVHVAERVPMGCCRGESSKRGAESTTYSGVEIGGDHQKRVVNTGTKTYRGGIIRVSKPRTPGNNALKPKKKGRGNFFNNVEFD